MAEIPFLHIASNLSTGDCPEQGHLPRRFFAAEVSAGIISDTSTARIMAIGRLVDHACGYDCPAQPTLSEVEQEQTFDSGLLVVEKDLEDPATRNSILNLADHHHREAFNARNKRPDGKYDWSRHELVLAGSTVINYSLRRIGALPGYPGYLGSHICNLSGGVIGLARAVAAPEAVITPEPEPNS